MAMMALRGRVICNNFSTGREFVMEMTSVRTDIGAWLLRFGGFFVVLMLGLARAWQTVPDAAVSIWVALGAAILAAGLITGGVKLIQKNPLPYGYAGSHRLHCLLTGATVGGLFFSWNGGGRWFVALTVFAALAAAFFAYTRRDLIRQEKIQKINIRDQNGDGNCGGGAE
jgi:hypothetical protein